MTAWMDLTHAEYCATVRPPYQDVVIPWLKEYYERKFPPEDGRKIPLVIDVACGTGQLTGRVAPYCDRVIAFDISPPMVGLARRINMWPNIQFRVGNALELDQVCPDEKADIIMVGMAINYFNTEEFYSKVRDHLKPGGVFAIFGYKTPGINSLDKRTLLSEFFQEQITQEPYRTAFKSLKRSYDNIKVPFDGEEHRLFQLLVNTRPEDLKTLLLSNENVFKDGREEIPLVLQKLPREGTFELICDVFGILTFK